MRRSTLTQTQGHSKESLYGEFEWVFEGQGGVGQRRAFPMKVSLQEGRTLALTKFCVNPWRWSARSLPKFWGPKFSGVFEGQGGVGQRGAYGTKGKP
jgi:hypothetical protein